MKRPASLGTLAREIVVRCIVECDDASERKARIMIAREAGLIDDDATALLRVYELEAA